MPRTGSGRVFQCIGAYFGFLLLAGCPHALDPSLLSQDGQVAVGQITAARLSGHIETLASDEYEGMIDDATLGFWVGRGVANAEAMPSWLAGDEFEAVRKAALEAVRNR